MQNKHLQTCRAARLVGMHRCMHVTLLDIRLRKNKVNDTSFVKENLKSKIYA
jgi:hypothetical protein